MRRVLSTKLSTRIINGYVIPCVGNHRSRSAQHKATKVFVALAIRRDIRVVECTSAEDWAEPSVTWSRARDPDTEASN